MNSSLPPIGSEDGSSLALTRASNLSEDIDHDESEEFVDKEDLFLTTNKSKCGKKKNSYSKCAVRRSARLRKANQKSIR